MTAINLTISENPITNRINKAKAAFTTRRVDFSLCHGLQKNVTPKSGDLVLARIAGIGQQSRLQLATGRRAHIFPGDEIIVAYGNRYAPDQFEGTVPDNLAPCYLVAAGGLAARLHSKHDKMKIPTMLDPIGLLTDKRGRTLNLSQFALKKTQTTKQQPLTLVVAGTSMNAGKTTVIASIAHGLSAYGLKVGAAKVTGTGAGGDVWLLNDCGADPVLDFVDAGYPSTYLLPSKQIEETVTLLTDHLIDAGVDIIVLEIADGLYQEETARLLKSKVLNDKVDGLLFAAGESMGVKTGVDWLQQLDIPLLAISGTLTRSPLAMREVNNQTDVPVLTRKELSKATIINSIHEWFPTWKIEDLSTEKMLVNE